MKRALFSGIALLCVCLNAYILSAQQSIAPTPLKQYHLGHYNGLPSNHVYCMLTDRHGYLYIGTDKGVVRYNGYTFKHFEMQDPDIWDLYEDKKGRVWVFRISEELGYIYNDKYHKVYIRPSPLAYVYPRYPKEYANGILFLDFSNNELYICIERNDTLRTYSTGVKSREGNALFLSSDLRLFNTTANGLYQIFLKGQRTEMIKVYNENVLSRFAMSRDFLLLNTQGHIRLLNTVNYTEQYINLDEGEVIRNSYHNKEKAGIVTNKKVYVLDDAKHGIVKYDLRNYLTPSQLENSRVLYLLEDSLWGRCIATARSGIYINVQAPAFKKATEEDLSNYGYVGMDSNKTFYLWNNEKGILASIDNKNSIVYSPKLDLSDIEKVIPYDHDKVILIAGSGYYIYDPRSFKMKNLFERQGPFY